MNKKTKHRDAPSRDKAAEVEQQAKRQRTAKTPMDKKRKEEAAPAPTPRPSSTLGSGRYIPRREMPKGRFYVKWELQTELRSFDSHDGLDNYLHHYSGKLLYEDNYDYDAEAEPVVAGRIEATIILPGNIVDSGGDVYDVCDEKSEELSRVGLLYNRLFGSEDYSKEKLFLQSRDGNSSGSHVELINDVGDGDEITQGSILYIDKIVVEESFRGLGLGLFLLDHADKVINSSMSLCLLIPYPLQYEGNQNHPWDSFRRCDVGTIPPEIAAAKSAFEAAFKPSVEKLRQLYALLGFRTLKHGKNEFMGRWNGYVSPSIKRVCPHLFEYH